jgi:protein transport protein SEC39
MTQQPTDQTPSKLSTPRYIHTYKTCPAQLNTTGLNPPPQLNAGEDSLPEFNSSSSALLDLTTSNLRDEYLPNADNPITRPTPEAFDLLALFVFSACILSGFQYPISVRDVARIYLRKESKEQLHLLQKILHSLSTGSIKDEGQWIAARSKLRWLWAWSPSHRNENRHGQGIFGQIEIEKFETEFLRALVESGHYALAARIYVHAPSGEQPLPAVQVERVILERALHHYDSASNGNRTRGQIKRASDIIAAFRPSFPTSTSFQRVEALLSATHAMSFYALTLQHGVPFLPVNIRVPGDPLQLLRKLVSQNHNSYTHLDDLITIGQNLMISMPATLLDESQDVPRLDARAIEKRKSAAERQVIGMATEAALEEGDFETAYSYVVNRLVPPTRQPALSPALSTSSRRFSFGSFGSEEQDETEDISWRAALLAGRYSTSPMSSSGAWSGAAGRPDLRRLEQRMELLSQALLLAPPSHLEEVLAVWQECEAETTELLANEAEEEQRFNDFADRRLPGAFNNETIAAIQPRREVGRGAVEEAPMGLFDVARGAAAAFSKSAFPLRANSNAPSRGGAGAGETSSGRVSMDSSSDARSIGGATDDRVRKRDMVASAVTGGLASGIGWVLGSYLPDFY